MKASLFLVSLLLLPACTQGAGKESAGPAPAATDAHARDPGEGESVMKNYDPANPDASLAAMRAGDAKSMIQFSIKRRNLGSIRQREQIPVEFPFKIEGDDPVVVTSLQPSCGCTEPRLTVGGEPWPLNKPIDPGSEGKVVAKFSSQLFKGIKHSKVTILSNALNRREEVALEANILPIFELQPVQLRFGAVTIGDTVSRQVEVIGIEPFEVTEWIKTPPAATIEPAGRVEDHEDGRQSRWYVVRILDTAATGQLYGTFIGNTTLKENLQIFVTGTVVGRVRYLPEHRLSFGLVRPGEHPVRHVRVLATNPGEKLGGAEITLEGDTEGFFEHKVVTNPAGAGLDVQVTLKGDLPVGRHDAVLKVEFPGELAKESKSIPISVIIRD